MFSFKLYIGSGSQDGGGIGRGDHFLPYKFIERTIKLYIDNIYYYIKIIKNWKGKDSGGKYIPPKFLEVDENQTHFPFRNLW